MTGSRRTGAGMLALTVLLVACAGDAGTSVSAEGTVEVDEIELAPMTAARVVRMLVEEGDQVRAGDTVAVLAQSSLPASAAAERARLAAAEAALRDIRAGARTAEIRAAEAELAAAEAEAARTARNAQRAAALEAAGAASRQQLDEATAAAAVAAARRDAAAAALRLLNEGARSQRIRAAEAEVERARAGVAGVAATADELILIAPVAGVILGRYADPGEVLGAGVPAAVLGVTERPWVRAYLSAAALAGVRVGQPASVEVDGAPGRRHAGRVMSINPNAEFTPRVALTETERADLMFGVRIAVTDSSGAVRPGLTASVVIDTVR